MSRWKDNTGIPPQTRTATFLRDFNRCVGCESSEHLECAHVAPRRRGGKGVITNLVTLCHDCHYKMDYTPQGAELEARVKTYMRMLYPGWREEDQIYHKWEE